jgi:hypothetical protein
MADDRRRRFSQIERPRAPGGDAPDLTPGTDVRFGAVEERTAPPPAEERPAPAPGDPLAGPPAPPVARGHTDRFRAAAEAPLEVDDHAESSQPFTRCCRCETDHSRYAVRCTVCGEPLDGDEQRRFNERLWAERRAQAGEEARAAAAHEEALSQARLEEGAARRALAEEMAREVGQQERRRLSRDGFGEPTFGPPSGWGDGTTWGEAGPGVGGLPGGRPIGFRLLALLPPGLRVAAGLGAVALAAGLFLFKPGVGLAAGVLLVSLFTPGGWRRRRSWW